MPLMLVGESPPTRCSARSTEMPKTDNKAVPLFKEETVSVKWAAKYLGCSVMTVLRYLEAGFIHGYQMSERGWWRIVKSSILEYEARLRRTL